MHTLTMRSATRAHPRRGSDCGQLDIDRTIRGFGTHALNSDAWLVARFDRSQGPRQHTFYNSPLTSLDHRGATGPALECSQGQRLSILAKKLSL